MTDTQIRTTVYKTRRPRRAALNAGWTMLFAAVMLLAFVFVVGHVTGWQW